MSTITLQTTQAVDTASDPTQALYTLAFVVTTAQGIDREVFVALVADDTISHVASVRDLLVYPTSKPTAIANGLDYYRVNAYPALRYTSLQDAETACATVQGDVACLNHDWALGNPGTTFGGQQVVTYDSSTTP